MYMSTPMHSQNNEAHQYETKLFGYEIVCEDRRIRCIRHGTECASGMRWCKKIILKLIVGETMVASCSTFMKMAKIMPKQVRWNKCDGKM